MFTWPRIIGVILIGLAIYQLARGRYMTGDDYGNSDIVDRSKNPVQFWLAVVLEVTLGLLMLLGVIRF
jgi:hypothetical protein